MKTLLLATALLVNPLNTVEYTDQGNTIITDITFNNNEKTNPTNTYQWMQEQNGNNLYVYQKYGTRSSTNQFNNVYINNYCQMIAYEQEQQDIYTYDLETFFIIQITPYRMIESSNLTMDLQFNIADIYPEPIIDNDAQILYNFYTTQANISNLIDSNNWATKDAVSNYFIKNAITNNQNKQLIDSKQWETINSFGTPNNSLIYTLSNFGLANQQINYIVGSIRIVNTITLQQSEPHQEVLEPQDTTQLLHTQEVIIRSTKVAINYTTEVVDIPGLMFTILGLPFSFISQAFDLTIFPGTPYQVNFSNIFLGFIAIAMLLWVLKLILGQADIGQWLGDQKRMHREESLRDRNHKMRIQQERSKYQRARALENQRSAANLNRTAQHNSNRHVEQVAAERAAHERAMKHNGRR